MWTNIRSQWREWHGRWFFIGAMCFRFIMMLVHYEFLLKIIWPVFGIDHDFVNSMELILRNNDAMFFWLTRKLILSVAEVSFKPHSAFCLMNTIGRITPDNCGNYDNCRSWCIARDNCSRFDVFEEYCFFKDQTCKNNLSPVLWATLLLKVVNWFESFGQVLTRMQFWLSFFKFFFVTIFFLYLYQYWICHQS